MIPSKPQDSPEDRASFTGLDRARAADAYGANCGHYCVGDFQGNEQIDDWEVWGDPKEIERRKAERKRAAMHPEARKEQVALFPAHFVYSLHRNSVSSGHVMQDLLSEPFFISECPFLIRSSFAGGGGVGDGPRRGGAREGGRGQVPPKGGWTGHRRPQKGDCAAG